MDRARPYVGLSILLRVTNKTLKAKPNSGIGKPLATDNGCSAKEDEELLTSHLF